MRVAEEKGTLIGQEVGYRIRFDDCTDPEKTAIKVTGQVLHFGGIVLCFGLKFDQRGVTPGGSTLPKQAWVLVVEYALAMSHGPRNRGGGLWGIVPHHFLGQVRYFHRCVPFLTFNNVRLLH